MIFEVVANLFKTGGRLNMGMPVKPLLARGIRAKFTPGFDFLRRKLMRKKGNEFAGEIIRTDSSI